MCELIIGASVVLGTLFLLVLIVICCSEDRQEQFTSSTQSLQQKDDQIRDTEFERIVQTIKKKLDDIIRESGGLCRSEDSINKMGLAMAFMTADAIARHTKDVRIPPEGFDKLVVDITNHIKKYLHEKKDQGCESEIIDLLSIELAHKLVNIVKPLRSSKRSGSTLDVAQSLPQNANPATQPVRRTLRDVLKTRRR